METLRFVFHNVGGVKVEVWCGVTTLDLSILFYVNKRGGLCKDMTLRSRNNDITFNAYDYTLTNFIFTVSMQLSIIYYPGKIVGFCIACPQEWRS